MTIDVKRDELLDPTTGKYGEHVTYVRSEAAGWTLFLDDMERPLYLKGDDDVTPLGVDTVLWDVNDDPREFDDQLSARSIVEEYLCEYGVDEAIPRNMKVDRLSHPHHARIRGLKSNDWPRETFEIQVDKDTLPWKALEEIGCTFHA